MMKTLYICEKPSQARDIAKLLGANQRQESYLEGTQVIVTWCVGHLLELAPPEHYCTELKPWRMEVLPILPQIWMLIPVSKTKKQLQVIKKLLQNTQEVVIATDADREGDVIGRELLDYFNYKGSVKRLWLSALDDDSIRKALATLKSGDSTVALYHAGMGRQRADWLVGMNLTMAVSCIFGKKGEGVLSVGRVQTPTLKLVVDRDNTIEQFKSKNYYLLKVNFKTAEKQNFWATWQIPDDLTDETGYCTHHEAVNKVAQLIAGKTAIVFEFIQKDKETSPPLCLSLSQLQKLASSQFDLSAQQTLNIAQSLYEKHKATTYPRTDCGYLPESQHSEGVLILPILREIDCNLSELIKHCDTIRRSPTWNDHKLTAHHGIIPTQNRKVNISQMNLEEFNVYDLIRRFYIAQFLGEYRYQQRQVILNCETYQFKGSSHTPLQLGWKQAFQQPLSDVEDEAGEEENNSIPQLKKEDKVFYQEHVIQNKKTEPPPRFTEGTLIDAMKSIAKTIQDPQLRKILKETSGIGTEATRATIIEKLLARGYIERKKKQIFSTQKGRNLINQLPELITNPATTAHWEQILDDIATGKVDLEDFLSDQIESIHSMLDQLKK